RYFNVRALAEEGPHNYAMSLPYTKRLVAQDAVNQSAAIVLTNAGHARDLGVHRKHWIFLESAAQGVDHFLSQRTNPARSEAMARVLSKTMGHAGISTLDLDLIDIYSCFPCAVTAACNVLDLPTDGSQILTVTGGLPYFGGPGNNYSLHALAEMAVRLRGDPRRALVSANGGMLSKHAAALLTSEADCASKVDWQSADSFSVDCSDIPFKPYAKNPQTGHIVTYTVVTRQGKPDLGLVIADSSSGERFLSSSTEHATTAAMRAQNPIGKSIKVHLQENRQVFSFTGS
ncbi:MAG: hypothetical protein HRT77_02435, partial [Halioglobus sp.]|nr:hypothetical protein [Halioglobus sp.]